MESKKGIQLSEAFGAVLTLVLVSVLVIIALVIFVSLASSFSGTTVVSVTGESLTPPSTVSNSSLCDFADFTVNSVTNTSGTLINSGNYTASTTGLITNTTILNATTEAPWVVNYSYTWGSEACTSSNGMVTEFRNYTSLIGLVGTIIFLGLVIGVLVASFVFSGRKV